MDKKAARNRRSRQTRVRIAEQAQVLNAAGIALEVGAADFLGAERSVGLHRVDGGGETRVLWRYGPGHGLHRAALMARERGLGESVIGVLCRSRAGCPDCPVMYDGPPADPRSGVAQQCTYRSPICARIAARTLEPLSPLVKMTRPDPLSRLN